MTTAHVVVPAGYDDPARPSGGNAYDRHIVAGLRDLGWAVRVHAAEGAWPHPDRPARTALARALAGLPDGSVVLVDGLVASPVPDVLVPESRRLRLVVLVHLPLGEAGADDVRTEEAEVLRAAAAAVVTSRWTRGRLLARYGLAPDRVRVAEPGAVAGVVAVGTPGGGQLVCVGAVAPHKGHDVLIGALASVRDLSWRCAVVGRVDVDPAFTERVRRQSSAAGLGERVRLAGPLSGEALAAAYRSADLLVLPSYVETYGMVVTEALAHGVPVLASSVGGVPEALGRAAGGELPGLLVPPGEPAALAEALRCWLTDPSLRARLRAAARDRRELLPGWPETALEFAKVLEGVA